MQFSNKKQVAPLTQLQLKYRTTGSQADLNELEEQQQAIQFSKLLNGPLQESNRQCKDLFCFFFYWANTLAMIILSTWAYFAGSPDNIYRATDSMGNICGIKDSPLEKYRYSYFYNPTTFDLSNRVCVEKCPDINEGVLSTISCYPQGPTCQVNVTIYSNGTSNETLNRDGQYFLGYSSQQRLQRICLPSKQTIANALNPYSYSIANSLIQTSLLDFISDVQNNYKWLFGMGALSIGLSLLYFIGLAYFPKFFIYGSMVLTFLFLLLIAFVFLYNGGSLTKIQEQGRLGIPTSKDRYTYNIYGSFAIIFAAFFIVLFACCLYHSYCLVDLLKIAFKYIREVPTGLIIVGQMTAMMFFFWTTAVSSMVYALSAADYTAEGLVFTSATGNANRGIILLYYFIFNALWTHEIFYATMNFAVASVSSMWYFSKGPIGKPLQKPMLRTLTMIMRYHFGSIAFGTLVLMLVKFIEFISNVLICLIRQYFLQQKSYLKIETVALDAWIVSFSVFLTQLSKQRVISTDLAIFKWLCKELHLCNLLVTVMNLWNIFGVNSIIIFVIRISIALLPTTIFYLCSTFVSSVQTNMLEPIYFVLIIFYLSLGMASIIVGSVQTIIDTLVSCFMIDQINQKYKGSGPVYALPQIADYFKSIR